MAVIGPIQNVTTLSITSMSMSLKRMTSPRTWWLAPLWSFRFNFISLARRYADQIARPPIIQAADM